MSLECIPQHGCDVFVAKQQHGGHRLLGGGHRQQPHAPTSFTLLARHSSGLTWASSIPTSLSSEGLRRSFQRGFSSNNSSPPQQPPWVNPDNVPSGEHLAKYGVDLTEKARQSELDPVIGREMEIRRAIQILSRRRKNNPVLIGEPGVGKTA